MGFVSCVVTSNWRVSMSCLEELLKLAFITIGCIDKKTNKRSSYLKKIELIRLSAKFGEDSEFEEENCSRPHPLRLNFSPHFFYIRPVWPVSAQSKFLAIGNHIISLYNWHVVIVLLHHGSTVIIADAELNVGEMHFLH